MALTKTPQAEPIPGYRLLEPLGCGGFGEVWKCEAPGGLFKAIKFVDGTATPPRGPANAMKQELDALHRVKAIRHPFLISLDRIEIIAGDLVIVMELADKNLFDVLRQYREAGKTGLPRDELLGYLWEAAEALDLMNIQYELQHLDIKPGNLFLVSNHVKIADFGLVNKLEGTNGHAAPGSPSLNLTPLYAPPERFHGGASVASDQYSLAIVYQELLTGRLPFSGKSFAQLLMQHTKHEPDLQLLAATDAKAVGRALSKDPARRFPSCTDFVRALVADEPRTISPNRGASGFVPALSRVAANGQGKDALEASATVMDPSTTRHQNGAAEKPSSDNQTTDSSSDRGASGKLPAGCRLLQALGQNSLGEVLLVRTSSGQKRLLKVLYGFASLNCQEEWDALLRLIGLRHPGLSLFEVLRGDPTQLVLASGLFAETLQECFQECRSQELPGIPRGELLNYLREAAQTLDALQEQQRLPHLGLNPHNLVVTDNEVLIADFGLVPLVFLPTREPVWPFVAQYAAPELLEGQVNPTCDAYSLALIYQEMLTGCHPYQGRRDSFRAPTRRRREADFSSLAAAERDILTKTLARDPKKRFARCTDLIDALASAKPETAIAPPETVTARSGRDRRTQDRFSFEQALQVFPALPDSRLGEAIEAQGKDISLNGVGVWLLNKPATSHLYVHLKSPLQPAPTAILARVMRIGPIQAGGYDVGLLFLKPLEPEFLDGLLTRPGDPQCAATTAGVDLAKC